MREMKDSGSKWIGSIPADWHVNKIKYIVSTRSIKLKLSETNKYIGLENVESAFGHYIETDTEYDDTYYDGCEEGDLLYGKLRPNLAKILIAPFKACCTGEFEVISYSCIGKRYLQYYMLTDGFTQIVTGSTYGAKMPRANWEFIANLPIVYPALKECNSIVNYLDSKCAEVDVLSADIQSEIDTLEAYKRSVITEAVTKGLDKNVKMKDSGVDWIGEIPTEWSVSKLGNVLSLRNERNNKPLDEVNLISLYTDRGVVQHSDLEKTTGNIAQNADGYKIVHKNDIVVNIILAWMGAMGISNYDGVTSPAYDVYKINKEKIHPHYCHYILRSPALAGECYKYGRGIMLMRWRTYSTEFKKIKIPLPPISEQERIADYLDKQCAEIESIISQKQEQLLMLTDYKKSLIFEYVTGKKEIA